MTDGENIKLLIVSTIRKEIASRKLLQTQVANLLQIPQPKVSQLLNDNSCEYNLERLLSFLNKFGLDLLIEIKPSSSKIGKISFRCMDE